MPQLVFGFLLLSLLSNCVSSKQSRLEEDVGGDLEEKLNRLEGKVENLLQKVEDLQNQVTGSASLKKQVTDLESRLEESVKSEVNMQCKEEVKKEMEKVLPTAVEKGLRDLPFEMVCAYQDVVVDENSIITYDRITAEFNNSDRPGGLFVQIYSQIY